MCNRRVNQHLCVLVFVCVWHKTFTDMPFTNSLGIEMSFIFWNDAWVLYPNKIGDSSPILLWNVWWWWCGCCCCFPFRLVVVVDGKLVNFSEIDSKMVIHLYKDGIECMYMCVRERACACGCVRSIWSFQNMNHFHNDFELLHQISKTTRHFIWTIIMTTIATATVYNDARLYGLINSILLKLKYITLMKVVYKGAYKI